MSDARPEVAAILFTDMVDSTALMQRVGDEAAQRLFRGHHDFLRDAVKAAFGELVDWTGDGVMAIFQSASDALQFAVAVQRKWASQADADAISLRVGLNVGEVLRQEVGSGYFGTPVVIASRLCDRARAGQILCSAAVTSLVAGNSAFSFRPIGDLALKGIAQPVATAEVVYEVSRPRLSPEGFRHLDQVPDIVVATDELGLVVYMNHHALDVLGYEREEVLGRFVVDFYPRLEEAQKVMAVMRDPGNGGTGRFAGFRTRYRSREGAEIPVVASGAVLLDEDGERRGTIGIARTV